jgi:hypothetical protein
MPVTRETKREWEKIGARARLLELDEERAAILKAFPDLRHTAAAKAAPASAKPRRRLSRAARKAMSEGMRRYWAKRKGSKGSSK